MNWNWKRFAGVAAIAFIALQVAYFGVNLSLAVWLMIEMGFMDAASLGDPQFLFPLFQMGGQLLFLLMPPMGLHAILLTAGMAKWRWGDRIWPCLGCSVVLGLGSQAGYFYLLHPELLELDGAEFWTLLLSCLISSVITAWFVYWFLRHRRRAAQ